MRFSYVASAALLASLGSAGSASSQCDLTTLFAQNNGLTAAGSVCYFDLNAINPIRITGLSVNTATIAATPITIENSANRHGVVRAIA